jgi:hypothetical protein
MKLYHATSKRKYAQYLKTGYIKSPVRGWDNMEAAKWWLKAYKGNDMVLEIEANNAWEMKDHSRQCRIGKAYWNVGNVYEFKIVLSE